MKGKWEKTVEIDSQVSRYQNYQIVFKKLVINIFIKMGEILKERAGEYKKEPNKDFGT